MKCPPEHSLLFFAALPVHDDYIDSAVDDIIKKGPDWNYLYSSAENFGVASGLIELLDGRYGVSALFLSRYRELSDREKKDTESMLGMYRKVAHLLMENDCDFIPLKGCDPRISEGSRRISNPMTDIDILVRMSDIDTICDLLEKHGFMYQGTFSGAHMNFFSDEDEPKFVELHWDLINRDNPLHRRLFTPDMKAVWERSIVINGVKLLSEEDLLAYLTAHAVKEYFQNPKWLADITWTIVDRSELVDKGRLNSVINEWALAPALAFVAAGLYKSLRGGFPGTVEAFTPENQSFLGNFISNRILYYNRLRILRPLVFTAAAVSPLHFLGITSGIIQRAVQKVFQ